MAMGRKAESPRPPPGNKLRLARGPRGPATGGSEARLLLPADPSPFPRGNLNQPGKRAACGASPLAGFCLCSATERVSGEVAFLAQRRLPLHSELTTGARAPLPLQFPVEFTPWRFQFSWRESQSREVQSQGSSFQLCQSLPSEALLNPGEKLLPCSTGLHHVRVHG